MATRSTDDCDVLADFLDEEDLNQAGVNHEDVEEDLHEDLNDEDDSDDEEDVEVDEDSEDADVEEAERLHLRAAGAAIQLLGGFTPANVSEAARELLEEARRLIDYALSGEECPGDGDEGADSSEDGPTYDGDRSDDDGSEA